MQVTASIIIRTYNEENYLDELLCSIKSQQLNGIELEIILVDSGSTDRTLKIAAKHNCIIENINKKDFTFGYSLNVGCMRSSGDYLVFISGHCIPVNEKWFTNLLSPLIDGTIDYCYGKQVGRDTTKFSEIIHFEKTFPSYNKLPQNGYFSNNANAAITRQSWEQYKFDEKLTGLEDMHLAKILLNNGKLIGYISDAIVYHIHDETWHQVMKRYEREAYALQNIAPELHFTWFDFFTFFFSGIFTDFSRAIKSNILLNKFLEIIKFRFFMFYGTYKGSKEHRELSLKMKLEFFYPKDLENNHYE